VLSSPTWGANSSIT